MPSRPRSNMLDQISSIPQPVPVIVPPAAEAPRRTAKIRVLHVVNGEHFAGAERVQSHLGRCLPQFGVRADFAFVKPGRFARMHQQQDGQWGNGFDTRMLHRFDLRPALKLCDLIGQFSYDLLHAHTPRTALIASLTSKLSGVPWVYHIHSPAARDSANRWMSQFNAWVERQSLHGCLHRIAVSESLRLECVARGVKEDRISVVHNGVPEVTVTRQSKPHPGGRWVLGMIALIRPRKGLEVMLQTLKQLDAQGHDVVLRCIGPFESGLYAEEIRQLISELGIGHRVEQVGFVDDIPAALGSLDALVLPSLYGEGLPMVVLEAMSAGLPVVATRVEGTPEAITHGVEGVLAEPGDPESLAAAITSLVTGRHDWEQLAHHARLRHRQCFSDKIMAEATAEVYRRLC